MRIFWDERQLAHRPSIEFFNGALEPASETPARAEQVLAAVGRTEPVTERGMAPLEAVHDPAYLELLRTAHDEWLAAGRSGDALPYCFPISRRPRKLERVDARLGAHATDTCAPITAGTWESATWAAYTALAAVDSALAGEHAFAVTRPPGHHAGAAFMGGYSYMNHACVSAEHARAAGRRVAVLDLDYHMGNGSEDILAGRDGLFLASLHADPSTDYPFFWGDRSEGNIRNTPLPRGTGFAAYDHALAEALEWIGEQGCDLLVISFGADTYRGDPISHFELDTSDYERLAQRIAGTNLRAAIVLEGGYALDALGRNVASFLAGF
ncbi:histone deacetylase family protein [Sphingomonas ginkgonis]|uniref:Histone deacetylase family protein n=1 Tax=Sphingomonas ginkgonis TaxID=2315330 RepID=A0A3S0EKA8_9SPHN|nr:histone deacetylase family protein [Sphingomonas ginkgonis]RST29616.1 histone deacetylase family protein [Sphingomonas ginkgonis]